MSLAICQVIFGIMDSLQLLSKKNVHRLGTIMNENVGSEVSAFARKQMLKMGWVEGTGLGKNQDGISTHIKVVKRVDNEGISSKEEKEDKVEVNGVVCANKDDEWWHAAFNHNAKKFISKSDKIDEKSSKKKSKKEKKDKKKKDRKEPKAGVDLSAPSFDDLFKATGGARLGMRARMKQVGKISRTECDTSQSNSRESENKSKRIRIN